MNRLIPILALGAAAIASGALAQSLAGQTPQTTILCLDVGGRSLPATCRVPASRLDNSEDICLCYDGMRVTAPVCPPGVKPPPETLALERARRAYLRAGTLVGASFEGRAMCVAPRNSRG